MNILSNVKILYKFISGFLLVILLMSAAAGYSEFSNQEANQKMIHYVQLTELSHKLVEHTQESFRLMGEYLLVENTVQLEKLKPKIADSLFNAHKAVKDLKDKNVNSYQLGLIDKYLQIAGDASSDLTYRHDLMLGLEASENKDSSATQTKIAELKQAERENLAIIQDAQMKTVQVVDDIELFSHKTFEEVQLNAKNAQQITIVILLLGIVLSLIVSVVITGMILKPINNLKNVAIKIVAGDLTQRANIESNDEIGYLAQIINQMLDSLDKQARQLTQSNKELEEKLTELQRFKELTVGRELKMMELKEEIARCRNESIKK